MQSSACGSRVPNSDQQACAVNSFMQVAFRALLHSLTTLFHCRTAFQRLAAAHCTSAERFTGQLAADDCMEQIKAAGKAT